MAKPIPEDVIDEVRTSVDIVDVVSRHVQLKKAGKNLFGICPFHDEKTPSFSVSEDKQIFHCFSCGRGGNVFKFLMDLEHVSFPDAVREVAEFGHVELDKAYISNHKAQYTDTQSGLIDMYERAQQLYSHILKNTEMGHDALQYLTERGITTEDIDTFGLGFAPDDQILQSYFNEQDGQYDQLRTSGLFIERQSGDLADRFTNRIMFPIRDSNGRVIAFSGRLVEKVEGQPKYLNSPETPIFNKGTVLYNLDLARSTILQEHRAILFEGFMDVIAARRAGVMNAIASMGTSLTNQQVNMLERISNQITICYDGDSAGQNAIARAIGLIETNSKIKISVIFIPNQQDPDEYVKNHGKDEFINLMSQTGESSTSFLLKFDRTGLNLDNETDLLEYLQKALGRLANLGSNVEQDLYLNQLSDEFKIDKDDLRMQMRGMQADRIAKKNDRRIYQNVPEPESPGLVQTKQQPKKGSIEVAEQHLLALALNNHDVWLRLEAKTDFYFRDEQYQTVYMLAAGYLENHSSYNPADFMDYLKEPNLQSIVANLESIDMNEDISMDAVDDYINIISNFAPLESKIIQVQKDLNEAVRLGNKGLQQELTVQLVNLFKQKQQV